MSFLRNKTIQLCIAILSVVGYGVFVFAAAPSGGYTPGQTLDPIDCIPGDTDCTVRQAWQQNVADGYVFNVDDMVGIGTDAPAATLDVVGDIQMTTAFTDGSIIHRQGDLTTVGGDHGIFSGVVNGDFSVFGTSKLDFNGGTPLFETRFVTPTSQAQITLSAEGEFQVSLDQAADISSSLNFNSDASIAFTSNPAADVSTGLYFNTDGSINLSSDPAAGVSSGVYVNPDGSINLDVAISGGVHPYLGLYADGSFQLNADPGNGTTSAISSDALGALALQSSGDAAAINILLSTPSTANAGNGKPMVLQVSDENSRGGGVSMNGRNTTLASAGIDVFVWDDALGGDRTALYLNEEYIQSILRLDPIIADATNETQNNIDEMSFWFHHNDPTLANESKYIINENFEWTKPTTLGSLMFLEGTTGNLGIGTDTPAAKLDVVGDLNVLTDFTGGFALTKQGDLAAFGGDHGLAVVVSNEVDITGLLRLDYNSGSPLYNFFLDNATNTIDLTMDSTDGKVTLSSNSETEGVNFESHILDDDGSDFRLHRGIAELAAYSDDVIDFAEGPSISLYTYANTGGCTNANADCFADFPNNDDSGNIVLSSTNLHGMSYNRWFNQTEDGYAHLELNANGNASKAPGVDSEAVFIDLWWDERTTGGAIAQRKFGIGICGGDVIPTFGCYDSISISGDYNLKVGPRVPAIGEYPQYALFPNIDNLTELNTRPVPVMTGTGSAAFDGFNVSGSAMVYSYDSKNLFFYTDTDEGGTNAWEPVSPFERGTTETHLFDDTDLVGLGTVATTDKLEVFGDIRVGTSSTNGCLKDFSGGTITGTCSSDERLKSNISPVTNILEKFTNINLVTYDWNNIAQARGFKGNTSQLGVLAQNVEQSFPELVVTDSDGYKQVNYARLNLLSIAAIKELNVKITAVETIAIMQNETFKSALIAWFANVANGIGDLFADNVHAKNTICIDDVCLTKDQLRAMINNSGSVGGGGAPAPAPAPEPTPDPIPDPIPDGEPVAEPVPEEVIPEPTPAPDSNNSPQAVPDPAPVVENPEQ
jgi:hypothetical protein